MANNYEQSTVGPVLPKNLFTELELKTLASFGMNYEPSSNDCLYFYSEESRWGNDLEIDTAMYAEMLNDMDNFVVKQYLDYIEANDIQIDLETIVTLNLEEINDDTNSESELTIETIFRSVLRKPKCDIEEIVIMGAFTCDKLRQGEFGGFVTRITKDAIQHSGTYQMLEEMRHPVVQIKTVAKLGKFQDSSMRITNDGMVYHIVDGKQFMRADLDIDLFQLHDDDSETLINTDDLIDENGVYGIEVGLLPAFRSLPSDQFETTMQYWDCECEDNYIHRADEYNCPICNYGREDGADSRVNEVLALGYSIKAPIS